MSIASAEFKRGWPTVLACTIGFALGGSGLIFYTFGVFAESLRSEFHWSMARIQAGQLVIGLSAFILTPLIGWLSDRWGVRRVAIPSLALFGLSFMALSLQTGDYRLYLGLWALMALSNAGTGSVVWSRAIAVWFSRGRGLALGITLMGSGLSAFLAPPLAAHLISVGGWRFAYRAIGAGSLCLSLPIVILFLRDPPADAIGGRAEVPGRSVRQAVRDWRFWVMTLCLLCVTLTVSGVVANLVRLLALHGVSRIDAAWATSTTGLFVVLGRLGLGVLLDRWHAPFVGALSFVGLPIACLLLASPHLTLPVAVAAAGLTGLGAAAEFDIFSYLVSRYFGLRKMGAILSLVTLAFYVGSTSGPLAFGRVYDVLGDYRPALWVAAVVSSLGALSLVFLGPYPGYPARPK